MTKRVVIAGCRNYSDYDEAKQYIEFCLTDLKKNYDIVIVSGGYKGADQLGERYAKENNLKIELHKARWDLYGKFAGPKRNREMAEVSDYIICFWNGRSKGTKSMIDISKKLGKTLSVKIIKDDL